VELRRQPRTAAGCPPFKKDSVLQRPDDGVATPSTVAPGSHRMSARGVGSAESFNTQHSGGAGSAESGATEADPPFDVLWWDPATLQLGAEPPFGLRRQELISKDVPLEVIAEGTSRYMAWRQAREEAVTRASQPSVNVRTATEWAKQDKSQNPNPKAQTPKVEVVTLEWVEGRPSGPRFGTLVHASLATAPLDADEPTIDRIVAVQARIVAAPSNEAAAARQVVRAVLSHALIEEARRAEERGALFRETPTTIVKDGQLLEGTVDLAFETADGYVAVDFKTDRAEGELQESYARQVQLYAEAITQATGKPARAVLMNI